MDRSGLDPVGSNYGLGLVDMGLTCPASETNIGIPA